MWDRNTGYRPVGILPLEIKAEHPAEGHSSKGLGSRIYRERPVSGFR